MSTYLTLRQLREKNVDRCVNFFKHKLHQWSVAEWGCATGGECGEAQNVAKKMLRLRDDLSFAHASKKKTLAEYRQDLADEIADTLIYLDLWAASEGLDLAYIVARKFNEDSRAFASNAPLIEVDNAESHGGSFFP